MSNQNPNGPRYLGGMPDPNYSYGSGQPGPYPAPQTPAPKPPKKKHTALKVIGGLFGGLILIGAVASAFDPAPTAKLPTTVATPGVQSTYDPGINTPEAKPSTKPTEAVKPTVAPSPRVTKKPAPAMTAAQEQAVGTAQEYLNVQGFSRSGLIGQLKFEGFGAKDAAYGADHAGADWNEEAVKVAKSYLTVQNFSRAGLVDQLEFEGFTAKQAAYGVKGAGL
jgi:hypothetical protein